LAIIAAGITGKKSDAEDIVQQAIAIAIEKDTEFESEGHFVGWLAGIVRNCALNYRRKSQRRNTHPTDPAKMVAVETATNEDSPVDRSTGKLTPFQSSFDDRVQLALEQIAPHARSCLLLRTVEELSYKEISELMDIPQGTAMNLVHRSKKKLRELLASNESKDIGRANEGDKR
jgi:RNA polymerase sigma-70 factor (ECF subfamily)